MLRRKQLATSIVLALCLLSLARCGGDTINTVQDNPDAQSNPTTSSDAGAEAPAEVEASTGLGDAAEAGPVDLCAGMTCNMPPSGKCEDGTHFTAYDTTGSCTAGTCSYTSRVVECTCAAAACTTDPCLGVACETPPKSVCADATTLRSYAAKGVCNAGACSYELTNTPCAFGCASGACNPDPCLGVKCSTPPANKCESSTQFRAYNSVGSCAAGNCSYSSQVVACTCVGNACTTDPCAAVTCNSPPAALCADVKTRRTYAATGTCGGGSCSYPSTDTACGSNQQCMGGACSVCKTDASCGAGCTACPVGMAKCKDLGTTSSCVACVKDADCGLDACNPQTNTCAVLDRSCADVKTRLATTVDGRYSIDPDRTGTAFASFQVWCAGMSTATPKEYLELKYTSAANQRTSNYSTYGGGGDCACPDRVIRFTKIRIDPATLTVLTSDSRAPFTVETLDAPGVCTNGTDTSAGCYGSDYATAGSCFSIYPTNDTGRANVDLRGTPFHVDPGQVFGVVDPSFNAHGGITNTDTQGGKVFNMTGGGNCGFFGAANNALKLLQD